MNNELHKKLHKNFSMKIMKKNFFVEQILR